MRRDPVCNMEVGEDAIPAECDGVMYYFCSEGCRDKFLRERACKVPRTSYDIIIIGGGPAGLTAAVYAATLKVEALLIAKDLGGQAIDSSRIENYMGFDFITGPELIEKFRRHLVQSHYIDHQLSDVERIEPSGEGFLVTTSELKSYIARALIIATGMTRRRLNIPGEEEFQRRGIFYGSIQDLSFVQGENVAVIGGGNSALQIAENLLTVAGTIHIIADSRLTADPIVLDRVVHSLNVRVHEGYKVTSFSGGNTLSGITIRKKAEEETMQLAVKGAFIAIGLQPNSSVVAGLVDLNERGEIVINPDCSTSMPGIFAAGDVSTVFGKRIIIACGEGAKAVMAARQHILDLRKGEK